MEAPNAAIAAEASRRLLTDGKQHHKSRARSFPSQSTQSVEAFLHLLWHKYRGGKDKRFLDSCFEAPPLLCFPKPSQSTHTIRHIMAARPRRKTLRSSCDACGDAKVKCDREKPECGRCLFMDETCTYSMCRRMGKPPRRRNGQTDATGTYNRSEHGSHRPSTSSSSVQSPPVPGIGEATFDPRVLLTLEDDQQGWKAFASNSIYTIPTREMGPAQPYGDSLQPTPSFSDASTDNSLNTGGFLTDFTKGIDVGDAWTHFFPSMDTLFAPTKDYEHDCEREARTILSDLDVIEKGYAAPLFQSSDLDTPLLNETSHVPLDQTLQVARRTVHSLGPLLACPCARSAGLALVYASVIWRILQVYRQATAYAMRITIEPPVPLRSSMASSTASPMMWPISRPASTALPGLSIGSFNVNDDAVCLGLSIQILSGEVRQVGKLIDTFAVGASNARTQSLAEGFGCDPEGFLRFWLKKEYAQTSDIIKLGLTAASA